MRFIVAIGLLMTLGVRAQQGNVTLQNDVWRIYDRYANNQDVELHTAFRPLRRAEINQLPGLDSIFGSGPFSGIMASMKNEGTYIRPGVPFNITYGNDMADTTGTTSFLGMGVGLNVDVSLGDKFFMHAGYFTLNAGYPDYVDAGVEASNVVPGMGWAHGTEAGHEFSQVEGYVSYSPNDIFNFQAGYGKHFIGDGYRSLQLSDNAANYPYLRISTDVWKFKYTNLFTAMQDVRFFDGSNRDSIRYKYTSTHHLSYNVTRWLNLGFFESIIWQAKDTLLNRGYDINYLNPIIFYRPVEFSVGSPDNALMGMNIKIRPGNNWQLYGQLVLDEFLLDNIREGNGWWANKYGIQGGVKWFNAFGLDGLSFQGEFNIVRPFTYSHGAITQNYGHMNQPLAHPLGANFQEMIGIITYQKNRFIITNKTVITDFGLDTAGYSFGGNIYQSYANRYQDYGNEIGQGLSVQVLNNTLSVQYVIEERFNVIAEVGHIFRYQNTPFEDHTTNYVYVTLRTNLWNQYTDY